MEIEEVKSLDELESATELEEAQNDPEKKAKKSNKIDLKKLIIYSEIMKPKFED